MGNTKEVINRKATYEYHFHSKYEAGIVLQGSEIKSIRSGHVNLSDAYCLFKDNELFVKSLYIKEYDNAGYANHESRRDRKLLLKKQELKKLLRRVKEKGFSIIPYRVYFSERNLVKVEIALAQGKKAYDKRESIKEKDNKRDLDRLKKINI
ncbi:MAG: SsrA-binding protein SmpB [Saprospiraceae bacterium]|jgi:SsrA-binding protein